MNHSDNQVYSARISQAQEQMRQQDIEFLFVTPSSDLIYLLGYPAHASERLTLLGIPADGEPFVVVPELESSRLRDRSDLVDIHPWQETESPVKLVSRIVEGAEGSTIAVSDQTWSAFLLGLQAEMDDARFASANNILRELRMIKDQAEIDSILEASKRTDAAWVEFTSTVQFAGRTERDVARDLTACLAKNGLDTVSFLIAASGPNSASPHHILSDRVIREGEPVLFDFGARWNHYTSDLTRNVHVGEPTDEYRTVYETVLAANRAALAAVEPGVPCEAIDDAAREVITQAGYGDNFIHRVGHGLGLDTHEEPYMVSGNTLPLRPGMVFSDEPGIYIDGEFGVRIEDILLCTEDGAESFNHAPRELQVVK